MIYGLFPRLIVSLGALLCVVIVGMGYVLLRDAEDRFEQARLSHNTVMARTLAEGSLDALITNDFELLERWVAASTPDETYAYAFLSRPNGQIMVHTDTSRVNSYVTPVEMNEAGSAHKATFQDRPIIEIAYPAMIRETHLANAHVAYFVDTGAVARAGGVRVISLVLLASLGALVLGTYLIVRWMTEPLRKLTDLISTASLKQPSLVDQNVLSRRDEVGAMARAFDAMIARLRKSHEETLDKEIQLQGALTELETALLEVTRASRAKSKFLATMSHEFRTPLNAILGFSEMLRSEVFGPLGSDNYGEYAQAISHSGTHMLALVDDVLDISAIEAGKRPLVKETIAMDELLRGCMNTCRHLAEDDGIKLSLEVPDHLPHLYADTRAVTQIILNLLSNAIKFTDRNGAVTVSIPPPETEMLIHVRDTGVGISHDKLFSVTEPFSQAQSDPHKTQNGLGLGLSIVKSLVEAHDGRLMIESEVGKGTIVIVSFPCREETDWKPVPRHASG